MENSQFQDKAIQLVYADQEGKYLLHPHAQAFLRTVPKPISVISVAGLYRTGKSYLLNRILLNKNDGFGVGPTINPHTKGLWCWGTPLKGTTQQGEKINILIIDSEGIGALDEDQNHDIKIFTLAILCSSVFIYNSVGSIDQNAIQNLSLVINLTKNIQLSAHSEDEDPDDLAQYFPTFFWVVRDFALQLISSEGQTITPKEYLQRALTPEKGFSDDVEEKNRIRRLLTSFFKERQCATLVRPLVNEQKLQHLYDCSFDDLRPEFVEQALNLRKRVFSSTKPKLLKGQHLDGTMYISILNSYLSCINNGGIPNIENAWTYMCIEKCIKLQEQCYDMFNDSVERNIRNNLPCSSQFLDSQLEEYENQCYYLFEKEQIGEESKQFLVELKQKVKQKNALLRIENQKESINVLKSYIMKNFTMIEKKMRMNEYENFQDFLKSINSLYLHLLEHGPDLPKKEIVYLDFLKKVTTQAAEVFLKQQKQQLQSLKVLSEEKERQMIHDTQQLKKKMRNEQENYQEKLNKVSTEKMEFERKYRKLEASMEEMSRDNQNDIQKMESNYKNKLQVLDLKITQLSVSNSELKQQRSSIESNLMVEKKEREKERALMDMKVNQLKEQIQNLSIKEKKHEKDLSELHFDYSSKLKESNQSFEKKIKSLTSQLALSNEKCSELSEEKQELSSKIEKMHYGMKQIELQYKEELKYQKEKLESYKQDFENDQLAKIKNLEEQNNALKFEQSMFKKEKMQSEKNTKDIQDRFKVQMGQYQTKFAVLTQKIQFLEQELEETKESERKSRQYYESLIHSKNQLEEEERSKAHTEQVEDIKEQFGKKISKLSSENSELREKIKAELQNCNTIEEKYQHEINMLKSKYQSEINSKISAISKLQSEISFLNKNQEEAIESRKEEFILKEGLLLSKIRQLELQIESITEQTNLEHQQMNTRSEDSIKQLKNYYELQKEKLELKIVVEKDKFEKKIQKMRNQYQTQLEEERNTYQEENQNLREQFMNEATLLKDLVESLQHQNDAKCRALEAAEKNMQEQKERVEKKEQEYNSRFDTFTKNQNNEKQLLQQKILEANQQKTQVEKEYIVLQHQKEELAKQLKELTLKHDQKIQEKFNLNKILQLLQQEHRQKLSDLSNEYMNEKLNYEKKLALAEQEKQFYSKKMNELETQQQKKGQYWEQKIKALKHQFTEEKKQIQTRKENAYSCLQAKYQKLKKQSKEQEQQLMKNHSNIEQQYAIVKQKYNSLLEKHDQLQTKNTEDSRQLQLEVNQLKSIMHKVKSQSQEQMAKLKKEMSEVENEKNQLASAHQKMKILTENKINFLEENKEKNKKEYQEKIKHLEVTLENIQKSRNSEKTQIENMSSENIAKVEKKYQNIIHQQTEAWSKKQKQYEANQKKLSIEVRSLSEKLALQTQSKQQLVKNLEKKVKDLEQNQKRAYQQTEKYKTTKQSMTSNTLNMLEKERQNMRQKLHEKEQRCKKVQNAKQQLFYEFEKQRAKWNLEKDNYSMKNEQLKQTIAKNEKDLEKMLRQNEKLKAERKNSKLGGSSFSRFNLQRNGSKFKLDESMHSINLSISKQNCNPLGDMSFFNNQ